MIRRRRAAALVLILLFTLAVGSGWAAETVSSSFQLLGLPPIVLTVESEDSASTAEDALKGGNKRSFVREISLNGEPAYALIRVESGRGKLWVDLLVEPSVAELTSRATAMDLSQVAIGHPNPAKDAIDDSALSEAE